MDKRRKLARDYLEDATLKNFWDVVHRAKINDKEKEILDLRFVRGLSITQIALRLNWSPEHIKNAIKRSYDKVAHLLEFGWQED